MNFMNEKRLKAMISGEYPCEKCGELMKWETDWEDILICPKCGYSIDSDHYGLTEEEYEALYPTLEEVINQEESDEELEGEIYEEVYEELDN